MPAIRPDGYRPTRPFGVERTSGFARPYCAAHVAAWTHRLNSAGLQGRPMLYPELFKQLEAVRWNMDHDIPWDQFDASPPDRGAGADDQDERHHRVGGAAGDRDVPARQPRRQRLLRLHERLVLRGAEAFAGADGVPAALPARPGADRGRAARGPLRFRSGAGARDADAAFLRRDPPQPLVPARRRVAQRAGDQGDLRNAGARRGAPRRRLPALHEAGDAASSATRRAPRSPRSAC